LEKEGSCHRYQSSAATFEVAIIPQPNFYFTTIPQQKIYFSTIPQQKCYFPTIPQQKFYFTTIRFCSKTFIFPQFRSKSQHSLKDRENVLKASEVQTGPILKILKKLW
jgi:hypothetical protein